MGAEISRVKVATCGAQSSLGSCMVDNAWGSWSVYQDWPTVSSLGGCVNNEHIVAKRIVAMLKENEQRAYWRGAKAFADFLEKRGPKDEYGNLRHPWYEFREFETAHLKDD